MRFSRRRARTVIAGVLKIINPVSTHPRNLLGLRDPFREIINGKGYVIEHPVDENPTWGIGVLADERHGRCPGWQVEPG